MHTTPPDDYERHARPTDPDTSKEAAEEMIDSGDVAAQCIECLLALHALGTATASEIDRHMGAKHPIYWRRCSDLHRLKLSTPTGERRPSVHPGGKTQQVYTLTVAGHAYVHKLKGKQ